MPLHVVKAFYSVQKANCDRKKLEKILHQTMAYSKIGSSHLFSWLVLQIVDLLSLYLLNEGNSRWNRLESLQSQVGARDLKPDACLLAYSCCLEKLYTPTWCYHSISEKAAKKSVSVSVQDKLQNWKICALAYPNDEQGVSEDGCSKGCHQKIHTE